MNTPSKEQIIDEALDNAITALGQCQKGTARQFLRSAIDKATDDYRVLYEKLAAAQPQSSRTPSKEQIALEAMIQLQDHYIQIDPRIALPIIQAAIDKATEAEYGRGVTAGKLEALQYTPEERERYGKWVAQAAQPQRSEPSISGVARDSQGRHIYDRKEGDATCTEQSVTLLKGTAAPKVPSSGAASSEPPELVVTKDGVPFEDQAEGIRQFKAASLRSEPPKEWQHKIADFVNLILHGDDEHKKWLREAGEAFILGQPMPPARHKRFACAYCHRGINSGVNLLRVNKLGDTPAVWVCTEHFNYDDWKQAR